jgi:signal transduction histidine kinase
MAMMPAPSLPRHDTGSPGDGPHWQAPRLRRDKGLLTGTAAGIADELGLQPVWVRLGFVVLSASGWGVLIYVLVWLALSLAEPRLAAVPYHPRPKGSTPGNGLLGTALVTVGLAGLLRTSGLALPAGVGLPAALVGAGVVVAWHRSGRERTRLDADLPVVRVVAGLVLAGLGLAVLAVANLDLTAAGLAVGVSLIVVAGLGLIVGPWASQLLADLAAERLQRIRSEERSVMAAHLHDSVLQTLALIQRNAQDPARMTSLARRQERELRAWLYGSAETPAAPGFRAELSRICDEVEDLHGVPVEIVVAGDADVDLDGRTAALAAATREAVVNAAKHSGAPRIDVFAELRDRGVEVFVRDVGCGFDPAPVPEDRRGLRSSIVGRMTRVGGSASVESSPGEGTEIELRLPAAGP